MEEWRALEDFPNYEVSNHGNVRSYYSCRPQNPILKEPRNLRIATHRLGYKHVKVLNKNGKRRSMFVHRLVAMAFVEGDKSLHVSHLDGSRDNNNPENLKWCTVKENMSHKKMHGTNVAAKGERHPNSKLKVEDVVEIKKAILENANITHLSIKYNISRASICSIKRGETWKHEPW